MPADALDPHAILTRFALTGAVATPVAGGSDTALWRVEHGGRVLALRVYRAEQRRACAREVLALRAAAEAGLPVPEIRGQTSWQGRPALLLSWCSGRRLFDELRARPWRVWWLGRVFGQQQARIHAVTAPAGLPPWSEVWGALLEPSEAAILAQIRALPQQPAKLLHLDYHPLNVLVEEQTISGVLDWANAAAGDARLDVARTRVLLRFAPLPLRGPSALAEMMRRVLELAWWRGYQEIAGSLGDMAPFYSAIGAMTVQDLAPKLGRPGVWLRPADVDRLRRWTQRWRQLTAGRE